MQCPCCNAELTEIIAIHTYTLDYSEEQEKWVKQTGDVNYRCGNCEDDLDIHDIMDALRQTDEM